MRKKYTKKDNFPYKGPSITGPQANTKFFQRWGYTAHELAEKERIGAVAIHMRVMNYGSPFMRMPKPSKCEQLHRKTVPQIAHELNLHPQTITHRIAKYGSAYKKVIGVGKRHYNAGTCPSGRHWTEYSNHANSREWIMTEHPQYADWKDGVVSWQTLAGE
jgi:hypothetical protein